MDENEYQQEEKKRFVITRGMVILMVAILAIIIIAIVFIVHSINKKKPEYTAADFKKLESRMAEETPNYLSQKNIELTEEEVKINLNELLVSNGGFINPNVVKAAKICKGYVIAVKNDTESYTPYIKCADLYTTDGYKEDKEKKKTTKKTRDIEKPVITIIGDKNVTININSDYKDQGATALDNIDGDLTSLIKTSGKVDTTKAGDYKITYTVTDKAGNKAESKRTVTVISSTTTVMVTTNTKKVNTTTKGNNTTKRATTNKARPTTTRRVTTPPTIVLRGNKTITINVGNSYKEPGYAAYDALGNDITSRVRVSSNVNQNVAGTYNITYQATDGFGNKSLSNRIVIVKFNTISLKSISVSPNSLTLSPGQTITLSVYFNPTNATNKSVTWSSSNTSVASVSNGIITAKKHGSATITVRSSNGKTDKAIIVVR